MAKSYREIYMVVANIAEHSGHVTTRNELDKWYPDNPGGWTYQDITAPCGTILWEGRSEAAADFILEKYLECDSIQKGTYCYSHNPVRS